MKKLFAFAVAMVFAGGIAFAQTPAVEPKKEEAKKETPKKEDAKKSAKAKKEAEQGLELGREADELAQDPQRGG